MNRWMLVLLLCVALYVGIVLVQSMVSVVSTPPANPTASTTVKNFVKNEAVTATVTVKMARDSHGKSVALLQLTFKGATPPMTREPTFEVVDDNGTVVHSGKFEFG